MPIYRRTITSSAKVAKNANPRNDSENNAKKADKLYNG
jgi:hypothetical protein